MAEEIRGLSVKFDADFTEFKKGMKEADKDINSTQRQFKTLQDSLKLNFDDKKFAQAQKSAQKALQATEQKASLLRQRLAEMEREGVTDKTRDEYNYLQETLNKTELQAQKLQIQLQELDKIKVNNLTKGLDNVAKKAETAAQKTRGISLAAAGMIAGIAAAGLTAVSTADEVATLATKYETTAKAIQEMQYVALQSDVEATDLYRALVQLRAGYADLYSGVSSTQASGLQRLGIDLSQYKTTEDQLYAVVEALAQMEDQTEMVSVANDIFGTKMATNILPLVYVGADAIKSYKEEFEQVGYLTDDQVKSLAEFDNVMNELKTQFKNLVLQLGSSLLPVMQDFAKMLKEDILPWLKGVVEWFSNLNTGTKKFILTAILLVAALSPMLKLFSGITKGISSLIKWFGKLDKATLATYSKWALLLATVGTLFAVLANWSKMNPVQRIMALLGSLSAVALAAAVAFGVFHSAWSIGLAVAGIVAGIATAIAAVNSAADDIDADVSFDEADYTAGITTGNYDIPDYASQYSSDGSSVDNSSQYYEDNSTVNVYIEKNDYLTEDDIIRAVNRGLKQSKQART